MEVDKAGELNIKQKKVFMGASNSIYKAIYYLELKQTGEVPGKKDWVW